MLLKNVIYLMLICNAYCKINPKLINVNLILAKPVTFSPKILNAKCADKYFFFPLFNLFSYCFCNFFCF